MLNLNNGSIFFFLENEVSTLVEIIVSIIIIIIIIITFFPFSCLC
jgi:hypothetical protein